MAKVPSKGTLLSVEITAAMTPVGQLTDLNTSGAASEHFDCTTLDQPGVGKTYTPTGYTEGGDVSASGFYDPALADHQYLASLLTAPKKNNWEITMADTGTTKMAFESAGVGFDLTFTPDDGAKFDTTIKVTGLIDYPTGV